MKTYTTDQLVKLNPEQIDQLSKGCDNESLEYIDEHEEKLLEYIPENELNMLKEYYTNSMEKFRYLCNAIVSCFSRPSNPGFPEFIYNINLKNGNIEADKNGRKISYSTEVLAPCSTSMLHYINRNSNDVFVILPPIKGIERSIEKITTELTLEHDEKVKEYLSSFEVVINGEPVSAPITVDNNGKCKLAIPKYCPTVHNIREFKRQQATANALINIIKEDRIPRDIYRLTVTAKYREELEKLICDFEEKFPDYIKFEKGERNLYEEKLSKNKRNYFDIKKIATITIPGTKTKIRVEFQFKQTNMFFAHIRSHEAYEDYRILDARYQSLQASQKNKEPNPEAKTKLLQLRKKCEEKRSLCIKIHRNAVHQSNLYLLNKILWLDDNSRGMHHKTIDESGKYQISIDALKKNYIVESYDTFDGATEFATNPNEHLNKSYYLKLIGILPENFNELGKNAKQQINKVWSRLTEADLKNFDRLTSIAIKYQDTIREIQKKKHAMDNNAILQAIEENIRG